MDTENSGIDQWTTKFYRHLEKDNSDLIELYPGRIHFFPQNSGGFEVGLNDLDERFATKDQIDRMSKVLFDFANDHPLK